MNCWNTLRDMNATTQPATANVMAEKVMDWAISSQAAEGSVEGSTRNANGLEQAMRQHERGAMKHCSKCTKKNKLIDDVR